MTPDCEKYEPLLLDELYEELDEVTSAAVKRHVSGCAHCGPILSGMKSTRRAVISAGLPMLELPAGLEDRILSSVKEAQKVVPIQSRAQRALSWAGSWAMRPQTAMAAVFLLMIGSSAFVLRARRGPGSGEQSAAVSVTEKGQPNARAQVPADRDALDNKAAQAAHGANMPTTLPPAASPTAAPSVLAENESAGPVDGLSGGKGRVKADESSALGNGLIAAEPLSKDKDSDRRAEGKTEGATRTNKKALAADEESISNAGVPGGAPQEQQRAYPPAAQTVAPSKSSREQDGYSAGLVAYRSRNFVEATKQFDAAAASGDQNSALWAARSVRDGSGCAAALPRFAGVSTRAAGTGTGNDATLEAARCQIAIGQLDDARTKLASLTSSPTHGAAAQQALSEMNQTASRKSRSGGLARPAAAAPAPAPQQRATEKNAIDSAKESGF